MNALNSLNVGGEVRISSGFKGEQQITHAKLKLIQEGFNVSYPLIENERQFF